MDRTQRSNTVEDSRVRLAPIAEHERARGQAETRATLAEQGQRDALERLEVTRRELRDVTALQQDTARRLAEALAVADRGHGAGTGRGAGEWR